MATYLLKRLVLMMLTLLGMSIVIFLLMRVVPGNIVDILSEAAGIDDPDSRRKIAADVGLDAPLYLQYIRWISGLFAGDWGYSFVTEKSALSEIAPRIPISLELAGLTLLFAVVTGVPFGVVSAVRRNTALDYTIRLIGLSGLSVPSFWLGLLGLMLVGRLAGSIPIYMTAASSLWDELTFLLLPAAIAGFRSSALIMRLTRASMLEVLEQDYIRTALSKGAADVAVYLRHALRNAAIPIVTIVGAEAGFMIGSMVVIETVFNIPGISRFLIEAVRWRDYPIVQNLVMFVGFSVLSINLVVDLLYAVLDPRIRINR